MTIADLRQLADYHLNRGERLLRTAIDEAELGMRCAKETNSKARFHLNAHKLLTEHANAFEHFAPLLTPPPTARTQS